MASTYPINPTTSNPTASVMTDGDARPSGPPPDYDTVMGSSRVSTCQPQQTPLCQDSCPAY